MKRLWIILFVFPLLIGQEAAFTRYLSPLLVGQENPFPKTPDQQIVTQAEEKILFVGNSFTYYWNLPSIVESMAEEKGIFLDIHQSTAGGSTLKQHWNGDKDLNTKALIENGSFTIVVLQDYSSNPLIKPEESKEYFNRFIQLVKSNQGKGVIYGTWMFPAISQKKYDGVDPVQHALQPVYNKTGSTIAPVGTAFRLFQKQHPEIPIFTSDNKHPSAVGSYLAACVFLKLLTRESPLGLSRRFERKDEFGKKVFLMMVEKGAAAKCQAIVDQMTLK